MGNNPSRSTGASAPQSPPSAPTSSPATTTSSHQPTQPSPSHSGPSRSTSRREPREPRRRESIQGIHTLSSTKATAAPPSASFESAIAQVVNSPTAPRRSQAAPTPVLRPVDRAPGSLGSSMGNDQSKAKAKAPEQPHPHATNVTPPVPIPSSTTSPTPAARPVTVPVPVTVPQAETMIGPSRVAYKSEAPPTSDTYPLQPAEYGRPPRLPLPIDEQVLMPGSPILAPREPGSAEVDELPRKESMLSSTTVDEEEIEDELPKSAEGVPQKTVPTLLEWAGPGEKVYVTGTFAKWDRKYKLHRNGPSKNKNALSATLQLQPGTHHLKFIVDGEMRLSDHLPTAVDFTNILVNYIEVSPDDIPSAPDAPPGSETPKPDYVVPANIHPPLRLSPPPEPKSVSPVAKVPGAIITPSAPEHATKPASIQPTSPKNYHTDIPTFLADYDTDERDPYFQRAAQVIGYGHPPPSLPMFLSKSILNSATPMKDDASVLVVPNHTVLNHLATSSIRHGVLATSGTTRYKRKFETTIVFKPTRDHDRR